MNAAYDLMPSFGVRVPKPCLRSKVILESDRLTVRYAFGEDSAQIGKIVGYRIARFRTGTFWVLRRRNGGPITIMRSYKVDDYFRDHFSRGSRNAGS